MISRILLVLFVPSMFGSMATAQTIYFVDLTVCPNDGVGSLEEPFCSLHDALDVAVEGDEVWVAEGIYKPAPPDGNRTATFQLGSGVALYGGFPSGFHGGVFESRDSKRYSTILSGDLNEDDGPLEPWEIPGNEENSYHVITGVYGGEGMLINGFHVTGGNANGVEPHDRGGGISLQAVDLRLVNSILTRNHADRGGAAIMIQWGTLETSNSLFSENVTWSCGSWCMGSGAGIYNLSANLIVKDSLFKGNYGGYGGGILSWGGSIDVCDSQFLRNTSYGAGGGIYARSDGVVTRCKFFENHSSLRGAGLGNDGELLVMDSEFNGGSVAVSGGGAGGVINGGAITIVNSTFTGNSAFYGAALQNLGSLTAINCSFVYNHAHVEGGVIENRSAGSSSIVNSILWANSIPQIVGPTEISFSNVENDSACQGCIDTTPDFMQNPDPGDSDWNTPGDNVYGDLRLRSGSPCVDAGRNDDVPAWIHTDMDGSPRFWNDPATPDSGDGGPSVVDMGAFEFGSRGCIDADRDGKVVICLQPHGARQPQRTAVVSAGEAARLIGVRAQCGPCTQWTRDIWRILEAQ